MRRLLVGLTGGIGTGKSSALVRFKRLGAGVVSLDDIARRLSAPGRAVHRAVVGTFGRRFLGAGGRLDRRGLAEWAFASPARLRRLEAAVHPPILRAMERELRRLRSPVVVADVPLLFEKGLQGRFDVTMLVAARHKTALGRAARRDGAAPAEIRRRMRAQLPLGRKEALADVVVRNDGGKNELARNIKEYYGAFELIAKGS